MGNQRMWNVVTAVLSLEVSKGHLKWKVSDLARITKVNRTLIYYHLGKSKSEIFNNCLESVAEEFYGLSPERLKMVHEGRAMDCVQLSRKMYQDHPEFMIFYAKWRTKKSPVQQKLIEIEARYRNKLKGLFPDSSDDRIIAYHAMLQGLVSSPFITHEIFMKSIELIQFTDKNA